MQQCFANRLIYVNLTDGPVSVKAPFKYKTSAPWLVERIEPNATLVETFDSPSTKQVWNIRFFPHNAGKPHVVKTTLPGELNVINIVEDESGKYQALVGSTFVQAELDDQASAF